MRSGSATASLGVGPNHNRNVEPGARGSKDQKPGGTGRERDKPTRRPMIGPREGGHVTPRQQASPTSRRGGSRYGTRRGEMPAGDADARRARTRRRGAGTTPRPVQPVLRRITLYYYTLLPYRMTQHETRRERGGTRAGGGSGVAIHRWAGDDDGRRRGWRHVAAARGRRATTGGAGVNGMGTVAGRDGTGPWLHVAGRQVGE